MRSHTIKFDTSTLQCCSLNKKSVKTGLLMHYMLEPDSKSKPIIHSTFKFKEPSSNTIQLIPARIRVPHFIHVTLHNIFEPAFYTHVVHIHRPNSISCTQLMDRVSLQSVLFP